MLKRVVLIGREEGANRLSSRRIASLDYVRKHLFVENGAKRKKNKKKKAWRRGVPIMTDASSL